MSLRRSRRATGRGPLTVERSVAVVDERQDGERVTRVALLVNDPDGDTWDLDEVRQLRQALGHRATELDLPQVSITLIPKSEAETIPEFA
jgi:hypothetical protein